MRVQMPCEIANRRQQLLQCIDKAALDSGRKPQEVTLLAVSKSQSAAVCERAYAAGQRCFAENYVQEALTKQAALSHLDIEWHFIGSVQANKTKAIAEHFAWLHSLDREKIADRLNQQRPAELPPLQVCIEVNLENETTKSGTQAETIFGLACHIQQLPNLALRGLMVIPAPKSSYDDQLATFNRVTEQQQRLRERGIIIDTLSMGMSDDFVAAIAAGSTMVRIGSALFGSR